MSDREQHPIGIIQGKPGNDKHFTTTKEEEDNQYISADAETGSTSDGLTGPDNSVLKQQLQSKNDKQDK